MLFLIRLLRRAPHLGLHWHFLLATLLCTGVGFAGWQTMQAAAYKLNALRDTNLPIQQQIDALQTRPLPPAEQDFVATLPSENLRDSVARDIGQFAQASGVTISSLSIDAHAATASEIGQVNFNVVAQAPYKASKAWIADLLGRHPSLGVQSLTLATIPNDVMRQDLKIILVWYVKD